MGILGIDTKGLPTLADLWKDLSPALITRAAYEINRPVAKAAKDNPAGALGRVGTVGVEVGMSEGTQRALLIGAVVVVLLVVFIAFKGEG